jgi:hypothetical protein
MKLTNIQVNEILQRELAYLSLTIDRPDSEMGETYWDFDWQGVRKIIAYRPHFELYGIYTSPDDATPFCGPDEVFKDQQKFFARMRELYPEPV